MEKKRNAIFDRILSNIPKEDKIRNDLSFQISECIYETQPNAKTLKAMREAENGEVIHYKNSEELIQKMYKL